MLSQDNVDDKIWFQNCTAQICVSVMLVQPPNQYLTLYGFNHQTIHGFNPNQYVML